MSSGFRGAPPADLAAAYDKHARALQALAKELHIPAAVAEELIDDALIAALVQKTTGDIEKWLAASLTAAAQQRQKGGE